MKLLTSSLIFLITSSVFGQYAFESKKAEKLYFKLDDAFLDYDYQTILEEEETIKETFLSKEDTVAANMYSFLGEAYYYELSEFQQALNFYNLELELRKKIRPDKTHSDVYALIALINKDLGNYSAAESILKEVVKLDREKYGKSSEVYYESAMGLAELYLLTDNSTKARDILDDLKKNFDDPYDIAPIEKSIGDCYALQGSFKKAEKSFLKALKIFEENGLETTLEYALTLSSLGILYEEKGVLVDAEKYQELALDYILRSADEVDDLIVGMKENLSRVYFALGQQERSTEMLQEALVESKEFYGENSFYYGLSLLNLARNYMYIGSQTKAENLLLEALPVFERSSGTKDNIDYGRAESLLSRVYRKKGQIDEAIERGKSAINTYNNTVGEDFFETAFPNSFLSESYFIYGDLDNAQAYAEKAYNIREKTLGTKHPLFATSANQLAIIHWKRKNYDQALDYYNEVFDNYFNQINTVFPVLTEEEKATFYYTNLKPAFEQYISFIVETSREDKELLGQIYDYQLSLKGLIMYATSKVRESILSSGDEELIAKYEDWISQKEQMAKLYSATDIKLSARNQKIDSLTETSNALEEELSRSSDVFGKNFAARNLTWRDVQKTLKPGEAAIEIVRYKVFSTDSAGVFTDEVHYGALIIRAETEDYPEMVVMRNGAQMENKYLANYRNAIKYKIAENYSYRLFWRPIANRLGGTKKIYLAPDGVYNQISIYTLRNPQTKDYLINEIDLSIVTNTKDLLASKDTRSGTGSVFFGYPNYNMGSNEEEVKEEQGGGGRGMRSGGTGTLERGATIPRGIRGNLVRYMRSFNGLAMLPGTKKEVELIDSLYSTKSQSADVYLLEEAVENKIKEIKSPATLHIATHGFFLELDPDDASNDKYVENPLLRSGLVLAGANSFIRTGELDERQGTDDGILTAFEAMNLNLDQTDIVVLSACETGLGEIKNGEGVYGLQRAFQIAGADAIIMSMWTVDDAATQELMTNFYEEWLSHGDKRLAFNTAQKRLKEKYDKPYYWGAFVMIGD